jgi:hypothetical protein
MVRKVHPANLEDFEDLEDPADLEDPEDLADVRTD